MRFSDWLRNSNEAKPFRDAMAINDQMPLDHGLRSACFDQIQRLTENAWAQTKKDLDL